MLFLGSWTYAGSGYAASDAHLLALMSADNARRNEYVSRETNQSAHGKGCKMDKLLYRPKEACAVLGIGRDKLYDLMRSGRIDSLKDGGARLHHGRRAPRLRRAAPVRDSRGRVMSGQQPEW